MNSTAATLMARDVIRNVPEKDRVERLCDALAEVLQKLDEAQRDLNEVVVERKDSDSVHVDDAPAPVVNLARARLVLKRRQETQPGAHRAEDAHETTEVLEDLITEVERYRELFGVEP